MSKGSLGQSIIDLRLPCCHMYMRGTIGTGQVHACEHTDHMHASALVPQPNYCVFRQTWCKSDPARLHTGSNYKNVVPFTHDGISWLYSGQNTLIHP